MPWCPHCRTPTPTPCDEKSFKTCVRYLRPDALFTSKSQLPSIDAFMTKMLTTVGPTLRAISPGCHFSIVLWTHDPLDPEWTVHIVTSAEKEEMIAAFTAMMAQWQDPGKMMKSH